MTEFFDGPWTTPRGGLLARLAFLFATLLVGAPATIRTWAAAYLGSDVVHDLRLHTESLVTDGPYRPCQARTGRFASEPPGGAANPKACCSSGNY
jgi:hypothetical protein